jgi:hypothetical protein
MSSLVKALLDDGFCNINDLPGKSGRPLTQAPQPELKAADAAWTRPGR